MPHFLVYGPDKPNSQRAKHVPEHRKYYLDSNAIQFVGLSMPPTNLAIANEIGIPVETTGTLFIYEAASFEEAESIAHGDPFWSSGEVWDREKVVITPLSVVSNTLPAKFLDFKKGN